MGLSFRKSFKIGKNTRINLSKNGGIGISTGVKGARISINKQGVRGQISKAGFTYRKQKSWSKVPAKVIIKPTLKVIPKITTAKQIKAPVVPKPRVEIIRNIIRINNLLSQEQLNEIRYTIFNKIIMIGSVVFGILMFPMVGFALIETIFITIFVFMVLFSKHYKYVLYMKTCIRSLKLGFNVAALKQAKRALKTNQNIDVCNALIKEIEKD